MGSRRDVCRCGATTDRAALREPAALRGVRSTPCERPRTGRRHRPRQLAQAFKAAPDLRDDERLVPWFFRILRNAVVDEYRMPDVARRHLEETQDMPDLPDLNDGEQRIICACFQALLPTLKPEYAELIQALDLSDRTPEAVATRLGITANNLKVRRHRARQALRQELANACGTCEQGSCIGDCTC